MHDDEQAMTELRTTTHRAPLPVLRAVVFALAGTALGVSAHHLVADGPAPWRHSAAAAAVLFAVGLLGVQQPRSLASVVWACGGAQVALHVWLSTAHPHSGMAMAMPSHAHHPTDIHGAWHERLHDSLTMTAVHAAVAVLVAVLLHRADTVCWSLSRGLVSALDTVCARTGRAWTLLHGRTAPAEPEGPAIVHDWVDRPPCMELVLADVVVRRGPPRDGIALAH